MKLNACLMSKSLLRGAIITVLASVALLANNAKADNWFDVNGTSAGYGTVGGGSYSWDDPNWATASGGTSATGNWVQGSFARFLGTGSYTVTVNATETNSGWYQAAASSPNTLTINASGSGNLYIAAPASTFDGLYVQGVLCNGNNTMTINAPITGPGGINFGNGGSTGTINLNGNNTYSGGNTLSTSFVLIQFNNNNAFGTGPINIGGTTYANLLAKGGAPITLPNSWTNIANSGVNFGSDPNTPVTCTGPWNLLTFNLNLRNNGNSTAPLTLSGPISGSGVLNPNANNGGTIIFSGANTYTGQTTLGVGGSSGVTLSVASINRVSGGSPTSNLGAPTTVANGTIAIGSAGFTSTLLYTGAGETSDRVINLAGTTGGATLQNDGSGPLNFTSAFTATGVGAKTLTLQGSNGGAISNNIVDSSSGATALVKNGSGSWILAAATTYTGGTTVNAGTLEIAGSIKGNVTNNANLTLDNASALASNAVVVLSSSTPINLNFTGSNVINTLMIDGVAYSSGVWGSTSSGAPNTTAAITGNGRFNVLGKPVIQVQPLDAYVFPDTTVTFNVVVGGDLSSASFQWKKNGVNVSGANISGANSDTLLISPAEAGDTGIYTCAVTNTYGFAISSNALLRVMGTNKYTETIRGDFPAAYWRLDETNGALAHDAIGGYTGTYRNVLLNQSGYSLTDTNDSGIGLPGNGTGRGLVSVTNNSVFTMTTGDHFTLEAWAYFTNLTGVESLFSTFALSGGNGWRFGINGANGLRFTAGSVLDVDQSISPALTLGTWYHLVCSSDGAQYHFYVNGVEQGTGQAVASTTGLSQPLTLGCNPLAYTNNNTGDPLAEELKGRLDEMAVYLTTLSSDQISNHFAARYLDAGAPIASAPVATPPTNYVSLAITLQESAAGQSLTYQWFKSPSTSISGATGSAYTISPLQSSDAGSYFVKVTGLGGLSATSTPTAIGVLSIPTNASELNLTNALVLHLPFDGDYKDISGRNNHGTNVGATTFVNDGAVGKGLHYSTDTSAPSTNYVTLGVPADLQFGNNTNFTVSYWIRQPNGSTYTNLPFIANEPVGSTTGWYFAPYKTNDTYAGGWFESIGSMTSPSAFTTFSDQNLINNGTWHLLVHSATRTANVITYLDGVQVDSQAIGFLGSISTTTPVNIGQDSSGAYAVTAQADIDDVGVWKRALTQLEVSGMYLAGVSNSVSFAPAAIVRAALTIQQSSPGVYQIIWPGGGTLQAAGVVNGTYTNVPSATSPYTVPVSSASQLFYRLQY
jgi:autotransporter-associated beta strand protein